MKRAARRRVRWGGHKPNILSGANRDWLLERAATDFTLRGLVAELAERGVKVDYVQVWRFVHAEGLSFKKRMARPVCKGDFGWRDWSASTYPVSGSSPGQDGFRAVRAS